MSNGKKTAKRRRRERALERHYAWRKVLENLRMEEAISRLDVVIRNAEANLRKG